MSKRSRGFAGAVATASLLIAPALASAAQAAAKGRATGRLSLYTDIVGGPYPGTEARPYEDATLTITRLGKRPALVRTLHGEPGGHVVLVLQAGRYELSGAGLPKKAVVQAGETTTVTLTLYAP